MKVVTHDGPTPVILGPSTELARILSIIETQLEILRLAVTTSIVIPRGTRINVEDIKP